MEATPLATFAKIAIMKTSRMQSPLRAGPAVGLPGGGRVLSADQAQRARREFGALLPKEQRAFQLLVGAKKSAVAQDFLWKALAAGHSVSEVSTFAKAIDGFYDEELLETLSLRDALPSAVGASYGLTQQSKFACGPSVAEALQGENDPVYALETRLRNRDVHRYVPEDATFNRNLALEQRTYLERYGGDVTPRADSHPGKGINPYPLYNSLSPVTGHHYTEEDVPNVNVESDRRRALEGICTQVAQGIATPMSITVADQSRGHGVLAVDVKGRGEEQSLLIHDPWRGVTEWARCEDIAKGTYDFTATGLNLLWDYAKADKAP